MDWKRAAEIVQGELYFDLPTRQEDNDRLNSEAIAALRHEVERRADTARAGLNTTLAITALSIAVGSSLGLFDSFRTSVAYVGAAVPLLFAAILYYMMAVHSETVAMRLTAHLYHSTTSDVELPTYNEISTWSIETAHVRNIAGHTQLLLGVVFFLTIMWGFRDATGGIASVVALLMLLIMSEAILYLQGFYGGLRPWLREVTNHTRSS